MSFNEVNELRKAGKLAEALIIAVDDYNALFINSNQLAQVNIEYDTAEFGVRPTFKSTVITPDKPGGNSTSSNNPDDGDLNEYPLLASQDLVNDNDKETLKLIKDSIEFNSANIQKNISNGMSPIEAAHTAAKETLLKHKWELMETERELNAIARVYHVWGLTKEMSYEDAWDAVVEYSKGNTNQSKVALEESANIQILNDLRSKLKSENKSELRYFDEELIIHPGIKEFYDDESAIDFPVEKLDEFLDFITNPEMGSLSKYVINKYLIKLGYRKAHTVADNFKDPTHKMREFVPNSAPTSKNKLWAKRALAWVYYDYLKVYIEKEDVENFIATLDKINQLELNSEEHLFFDQCAFVIAKMVFAIKRKNNIDFDDISRIFNLIKDYPFTKPSEGYSALFNAFNKEGSKWPNFLEFADWWDFENFDKKSYIPFVLNGRNLLSTAEQAFINYAKSLLGKFGSPDYKEHDVENLKRIGHQFITQLDKLIEEHPEFMYPPYYKAKLLIALGEGKMKETLDVFIPFARQRKRDFWVWDMMAQLFPDDDEMALSCYCKALSCPTTDEFLVNIRQSFAGFLIDQKKYSEAKSEILNVLNTRKANKWRIPEIVNFWCNQDWFISSTAKLDNKYFYDQHKTKAEEILYRGMEEEIIVVEFVNSERKILNFIKTKEKFGFFKYQGFIVNPQIGDILAVRFSNSVNEGRYGILSCRNLDSNTLTDAIREFEGVFKPAQSGRFGFADDAYVDETLIAKYQLENFNVIKGKAMLSFNKKKGTWGWKAIEIYKSELT